MEEETTVVGRADVQRAKESQLVPQQLPIGKISVADTFPVKFGGMTSNRVEETKQGRRNKLAKTLWILVRKGLKLIYVRVPY